MSFGSKETELLWRRERVRSIDPRTHRVALRKVPGWDTESLEALKGDRAGQHSIRINDQWRICFLWTDAGPEEMEIVDYH